MNYKLVFCTVLATIAVAGLGSVEGVQITLDDILQGKYISSGWGGTWISDDTLQRSVGGSLVTYNVATNENATKFDGSTYNQTTYPGRSFTFSADEEYILITHSVRSLWRHSFLAKYHIATKAGQVVPLIAPDAGAGEEELQLVKWSPVGNSLIFVYNGDIYYRPNATASSIRLTTDGDESDGVLTNGHTDWVYEEEMFGDNTAAWFSPNAQKLVYIKFDDTQVEEFLYPIYGEPRGRNETNSYPEWKNIKYPRPGTTNPVATLHVVDLQTLATRAMTYTGFPPNSPILHYIGQLAWANADSFVVTHLNREQQEARWFRCNPTGMPSLIPCTSLFSFNEPNGWIDLSPPVFSGDGLKLLTLTTSRDFSTPTHADYKHIIAVDTTTGVNPTVTRLNNENYSVDSILRWNETANVIYFTASGLAANSTAEPSYTHVYRINWPNPTTAACLTCSLRTTNNDTCLQNSISFSRGLSYALHTCSGPNIPETVIRNTRNNDWAITRVLANNNELRDKLVDVEVPTTRDYLIPSPEVGGLPIRARLFLPANFSDANKYPLFIDVYGGPGSQNIRQGFSINWGTSLVSSHEVIYGFIDGRGSGRQTSSHLFKLRHALGTVEIEDQIAAAKYLIGQNSFIDANRTAIWGWSYGGYATAMVMAKDKENVFKCGISVAPVTSWFYYDTIYTERYMGEPKDNRAGYAGGDVTTVENAKAIGNHQFFLVHGNADDNVHYQQSMMLARALEQNDVMFNQLSYPDEAHSINSAGMRQHLYHSLEKFLFRDCFPDVRTGAGSKSSTMLISWSLLLLSLGIALLK